MKLPFRGYCLSITFSSGLLCTLLMAGAGFAQSQPPSTMIPPSPSSPNPDAPIAAAARDAKTQKTAHAKKVFSDEDIEISTGPVPRVKMDGLDNSDDILAAIGEYKKKHTSEETEQVIHDWFDEYDAQLFAVIQDNQNRRVLSQENQANGYELCRAGGDYEKCAGRQASEAVGARNDARTIEHNNALIHRLQQALMKIRNGLARSGLQYKWFKVRTTNNIDSV